MNIPLKIQVRTKSQNLTRIAATTKWWSKQQTARDINKEKIFKIDKAQDMISRSNSDS